MLAYLMRDIDNVGFEDIPIPRPGAGEVLVRLRASSLNPHDAHVLHGFARAYMEYDLPAVLGTDAAGAVEAVGPDVSRVEVGDRVFGLERSDRVHNGTFAEYVVLPENTLVKTPDNVDDASAGTLGLAASMALTAVDAMEPAGRSVLINGATGGVGCFVTQLAVHAGARVIATARAGAEADLLRELGAQVTVDWTEQDAAEIAAEAGGVDLLLDLVSRDDEALQHLASRALAAGGRVFTTLVPQTASAEFLLAEGSPELLDRIAAAAAAGDLKPVVQTSYRIQDVDKAFAALGSGTLGKLALTFD